MASLDKSSLLAVLKKIFEEHGVVGLFAGLHAKLWQTVLNSAFMYMTYEIAAAIYHACACRSTEEEAWPF